MEQIFLLLRIALAQVLSGGHETAPLILDDVTVQSDQERTIAIMRMLHELSADARSCCSLRSRRSSTGRKKT